MRRLAFACAALWSCETRPHSSLESRELLNPLKTTLTPKPVFVEPEDDSLEVRYKRHYSAIPQKMQQAYEAVMYMEEPEDLLDLSDVALDPKQLQQVFHLLRHYSGFTTVIFEGNQLAPEDVRQLCESLLRQERLEDLDLTRCGLGDEGAAILAEFLPRMKNLRQLRLSRNGLGPVGVAVVCRALKKSQMSSLWFSHNVVGEEGAEALGDMLLSTKLRVLGLSDCGLDARCTKKLARGVEKDKRLKHLIMSKNPLGAEGMREFATRLPQSLRKIDLASTQMGPIGARYLGIGLTNTPGIEEIYIERNSIMDEGIHFIAASQSRFEWLKHLSISHNELTDLTCNFLCSMLQYAHRIRTLRITHCRLGKGMEGVTYRLPTLRFLDARESHIYFHLTIRRNLPNSRVDLSTSVDF